MSLPERRSPLRKRRVSGLGWESDFLPAAAADVVAACAAGDAKAGSRLARREIQKNRGRDA
jgi:hypothetical protein